jgi:hypothetical protein
VPYKNVYCQFFWIVHFLLPLWYGLQILMTAMSHKQEALQKYMSFSRHRVPLSSGDFL